MGSRVCVWDCGGDVDIASGAGIGWLSCGIEFECCEAVGDETKLMFAQPASWNSISGLQRV